ncbi:YbaB/EbfC family nucleoid-associated protein [Amycolatopsis sp. NPDC101161]|uniref:YbaB/EbfC family nucleoid-associated protein n=1 Tax=Amycolatopsis sp. NPDC101161 TaxID=3363940 RepID=UPI00382BA53A
MTAQHRDLRQLQHQAAELDARLAATRHTARSSDQLVTVTVTGQEKLLDLRIDDRALHGAHVQKLGFDIVEAVRNARAAARASSLPHLNALFGKQPPPPPPSATGPAAPPQAAAPEPARRAAAPEDEENFADLDFLTDDEPDAGGGRW